MEEVIITNRPKEMDLNEFTDKGYLLEVNRQFLHPLGLAMYVNFDEEGKATHCGIYDDRGDPEGWYQGYLAGMGTEEDQRDALRKVRWIADEWRRRVPARVAALGYIIQPIIPGGEPAVIQQVYQTEDVVTQ